MTFKTVVVNTPPPYLTLNKDEPLSTVMTIAGSDSSGGAGIEADIKTITAHKCYAMTCITALTVQSPVSVYGIHPTPKDVVKSILEVNLKDMRCDAIKTGVLTLESISALNEVLLKLDQTKMKPKLVVDPVLVATSGSSLAKDELIGLLIDKVIPFADLLTPNIPECFKLLGEERNITNIDDVIQIAKDVRERTKCSNVLVKGGHIPWEENTTGFITDILLLGDDSKVLIFKGNHTPTSNTHGTGCTLSSAIASNLARGYTLEQSVYGGVEYVQNAIAIGCNVMGKHVDGNGPINHVYAISIPLETMLNDECFNGNDIITNNDNSIAINPKILKELPLIKQDFTSYLESHPLVEPHWSSYINHEFVKQIAIGTLPRHKFKFFIEQDYSYLVDYGRVHCIAASKAPTLENMEEELSIVSNIKTEMNHHREKLIKNFNASGENYFANIERGNALKNYSRYFADIAKRGNWAELIVSLTPCLMGYGCALKQVQKFIKTDIDPMYKDWLDVYSNKMYTDAMDAGRTIMNEIASTYPPEQLEILITIYADVCELETKFWDAALQYEN